MSVEKQRKVLDRAITHQLIVLENPPPIPNEDAKNKEQDGENNNSAVPAVPTNMPIIKPSSLNYKISLRQAVEDFIKKESNI